MTWQQITEKIESDLHVGDKVGRRYLKLFRDKYKGQKEAIQQANVSFNNFGQLVFRLTINDIEQIIII